MIIHERNKNKKYQIHRSPKQQFKCIDSPCPKSLNKKRRQFKRNKRDAGMVVYKANSLALVLASNIGTNSSFGCTTFDPAPCLWLGNQQRRTQILEPYIHVGWLLALDRLISSHCSHLRVNQGMEDHSFYILLSTNLPFKEKELNPKKITRCCFCV